MDEAMTVDDYIERLNERLQEPGRKLQDVLNAELPTADSLLWEDRPTWVIGKVPVAAFEAGDSYLTFLIFRGDEITDSTGTLTMHEDGQASLRIVRTGDIDEDLFMGWLRQVQEAEG